MKELSMNRFATLWTAECDFERDGKYQVNIFEPLNTTAPADARVSCSSWDISFYDRTGNKLIETCRCHNWERGASPSAWLLSDGKWYEVGGGEVRFIKGKWNIVRRGWRNSRVAHMMNHGWPRYKR